MTTIAYISDFSEPWYTPAHVARDAEALGCTVLRIDEQILADVLNADDERIRPWLPDADLILYTKHHGLPESVVDLWRKAEKHGARTASFHLDLYRGLPRGSEILDDPFWRTGTIFTADGDPGTEKELALVGIRHRWLPAACVSDEAIEVDDPFFPAAQIVFVGSSHSYHPEWTWRLTLLAALRRRYGLNFEALGTDGVVRGLDLNRLYQQPGRIVVGDSLMLPGHRNYWSDRYYETIGRGGFLIAPRVPGLEAHFQDGAHFLGYDPGDIDGLYGLIDGYLDQPDLARTIARSGQQHVAAHHTYQHRVRALLEGVGL